MKIKHCPYGKHDLPLSEFTSTRAKYCNNCKRIRQLEMAKQRRVKQLERLKNKKQKTKTKIRVSDLKKKVQRVFNKWIRQRDEGLPCISCGKHVDNYEAGHYIAQGSSGFLRYHEDNVHSQCKSCNRFKHGNLIEYRIALIQKIGIERVHWLERNRHKTHKWQREELEELIEKYK